MADPVPVPKPPVWVRSDECWRSEMNVGSKIAEVRVSKSAICIVALAAGGPTMLGLLFLADALRPGRQDFRLVDLAMAMALFVPVGIIHELLHALAAIVHGGLHPRDLRIRVVWKAGALACQIRVPIRVGTARFVALTPLVVTAFPVLGLFLWRPCHVLATLLGLTIIGCMADLIMVYCLRRLDADLLVVDHPSEPAFDVYAPEGSR